MTMSREAVMEYAVEVSGISHSFNGKNVLSGIDLQIREGEIFGLLGPSGAGKTTLIRILTGQLRPAAGNAAILGMKSGCLKGADYKRIGIMMDSFGLYERLSCYDNLKIFAVIYGVSNGKIGEVLEAVGLSEARKTAAMNLSKGMRSRLMLARVLLQSPQLLFLDEPASGLDPATAEEIHQLLQKEREQGVTIFLTTHIMAEAEKLCDHIALLNEGRIVEYGTPAEICRRYDHQRRLKLHLYDGTDVELPNNRSAAKAVERYLEQELVETIHSTEPNLETVFMELSGKGLS